MSLLKALLCAGIMGSAAGVAVADDASPSALQQFVTVDQQMGNVFDNLSFSDFAPKMIPLMVGRWLSYGGPITDVAKSEETITKLCGRSPASIRSDDPLSFTLTRGVGTASETTVKFTSVGFLRYAMTFDSAQILHGYGMDKPDTPLGSQLSMLRSQSGFADVELLSKDVLLISANGFPTIYLRCAKQ